MPRNSRRSYQKLKQEINLFDEEERELNVLERRSQIQSQSQSQSHSHSNSQSQPQRSRSNRVHRKRRWKIRISGLRRFFRRARKTNLVWASWAKVVRRLKESQTHFGDLFAGNYLFLQVTPDSLKVKSKAPLPAAPVPSLPSSRF